jgi:hypothetical protein
MRKPRLVPEFTTRTKRMRAGFMPSEREEVEVETWQVWCRNAETGDDRRATTADLRRAARKRRR